MEIVGVHPWVADCWDSLFGCDPPWTCLHLPPFRLEVGHPIIRGPFHWAWGEGFPSLPAFAGVSVLSPGVGRWASRLVPFVSGDLPAVLNSLSLTVSGRYFGVPSLLAPLVVFGADRPPSLVLLVSPTRGFGAGVARCLARAPWFARVGRDPVPCPPVQNGLWGGAGGEVSR